MRIELTTYALAGTLPRRRFRATGNRTAASTAMTSNVITMPVVETPSEISPTAKPSLNSVIRSDASRVVTRSVWLPFFALSGTLNEVTVEPVSLRSNEPSLMGSENIHASPVVSAVVPFSSRLIVCPGMTRRLPSSSSGTELFDASVTPYRAVNPAAEAMMLFDSRRKVVTTGFPLTCATRLPSLTEISSGRSLGTVVDVDVVDI